MSRSVRALALPSVALVLAACGPKQQDTSGSRAQIVVAPAPAVEETARETQPVSAAEPEPSSEPAPEPDPEPEASSPEAAACVASSKLSLCLPLFGATMDDATSLSTGAECTSSCIGRRSERLAPVIDRAAKACVDAYVKGKGRTQPKCVFPQYPQPKDPREMSMRFQDALRAAVEKRDRASVTALDRMLERLDSPHLARAEPDCTRTCLADGAAALATAPKP